MLRSISAALVTAAALTACMHLAPAPSFEQELNKQYNNLSTAENEPMYDWTDAEYFQTKGARALAGKDVQPEDPMTWKVQKEHLPELNNAYDMLQIALVMDEKKVTAPIPAAQAQAYFDCWVEQSQEKWTPVEGRMKDCRKAFYDAFCRMYGGDCTKTPMTQDNIFRVFFATDSTALDAEAHSTISKAVAAYKAQGKEIIVAGHADRVGSAAYNVSLSKRRAEAVRNALNGLGISEARIDEKFFGESQPLVETPDEVPNQSNRRALIVVR